MDWKVFLTVFGAMFLAEMGDKSQLATALFAADENVSKWTVFFAASAALVTAVAIGVLAGSFLANYLDPRWMSWAAGIGFILIGAWTLYTA